MHEVCKLLDVWLWLAGFLSPPTPQSCENIWKHFISLAWNEEHPDSHPFAIFSVKLNDPTLSKVQLSDLRYCGLWGRIEEVRELNGSEPGAHNFCDPEFISTETIEYHQGEENIPLFTAAPRGKSSDVGEKVRLVGSGTGQLEGWGYRSVCLTYTTSTLVIYTYILFTLSYSCQACKCTLPMNLITAYMN